MHFCPIPAASASFVKFRVIPFNRYLVVTRVQTDGQGCFIAAPGVCKRT
jgi:hypothetical protein